MIQPHFLPSAEDFFQSHDHLMKVSFVKKAYSRIILMSIIFIFEKMSIAYPEVSHIFFSLGNTNGNQNIEKDGKPFNCEQNMFWDSAMVYRPVMNLDPDINEAMRKMNLIEELYESFPKLDCGSCGSPSCRALAEDIVRGYAKETDCIFKLRDLAKEVLEQEETHKTDEK